MNNKFHEIIWQMTDGVARRFVFHELAGPDILTRSVISSLTRPEIIKFRISVTDAICAPVSQYVTPVSQYVPHVTCHTFVAICRINVTICHTCVAICRTSDTICRINVTICHTCVAICRTRHNMSHQHKSHMCRNMSHQWHNMSHQCRNMSHQCHNMSHQWHNMSHQYRNMSHTVSQYPVAPGSKYVATVSQKPVAHHVSQYVACLVVVTHHCFLLCGILCDTPPWIQSTPCASKNHAYDF